MRDPAVVLPCMIDAADDPARLEVRPPREKIATVASFGNLVSLRNTVPYLAAVTSAPFAADFSTADVFVLAHGDREAPLKDNNRLIMAMSLGVPAIVSPTPAYVEVLEELGLGWLTCRPPEIADRLAAGC